MKKMMMIAALTMVAGPAFASKARLNALQNAEHLSDVQRTFDRPQETAMHSEYATVEAGTAGNAEGGFVRQMNENSYLGFYVGRRPAALQSVISNIAAANSLGAGLSIDADFLPLDNAFNVMYGVKAGDLTWGLNLYYLSSNKKNNFTDGAAVVKDRKADVMGVSAGVAASNWEADAVIGLTGKAGFNVVTAANAQTGGVTAGNDFQVESTGNYTLRGAYKNDTQYYYAKYNMGGTKLKAAGTEAAKLESTTLTLGVLDSMKKDGAEFFYGISYVMGMTKTTPNGGAESKTDTTSLPIIVGVEADAASWVVLRGSLTHNLPFLGSTKTTGGESDTLAGNTTAAAGLGLKFNKFTVDAVAAAGTSGNIGFNAPDFLTTTSLTYLF